MTSQLRLLCSCAAFLFGCAAVTPEQNTVAEHEAIAASEEKQAAALSRQCAQAAPPSGEVCWSATAHPTASDLRNAEKYRRLAAEHRAAAATLREAEEQACAGVPERDRDMSPFAHREDIVSAERLSVPILSSKNTATRLVGATIVFRAVPGLTAEWLQRVLNCHLARNAAMGWDMPEMSYCPVAVKGANASVSSTGNGFSVTVRSDDVEAASEIARRAAALH